jgi:hypothetical protein
MGERLDAACSTHDRWLRGRVRKVGSLRNATQLLIGSELIRRSVSHRSTTRDAFTLVAHQQLHISTVLSGQLTADCAEQAVIY